MKNKQHGEAKSGGIGLLGLIFIVFLFLKLAEIGPVATWSWWYVTVPLWGGLALILAIVAVALVVVAVTDALSKK